MQLIPEKSISTIVEVKMTENKKNAYAWNRGQERAAYSFFHGLPLPLTRYGGDHAKGQKNSLSLSSSTLFLSF